jgi:hypothetical protein
MKSYDIELGMAEKTKFQSLVDSPSFDSLPDFHFILLGNEKSKLVFVKYTNADVSIKNLRSSVNYATLRDYYLSVPFGLLNFESKEPINLKLAKLQQNALFINFNGSSTINSHYINQVSEKKHKTTINHLLNTILSFPRDYILFLNDNFIHILAEYVTDIDFFTINIDETFQAIPSKRYRFTRLTIRFGGKDYIVGVADSYADNTLNGKLLSEYGNQAITILKRGMVLKNPLWGNK